MHTPTIRVANPASPGSFMTIDVDALTHEHDVWPHQAEGFTMPVKRAAAMDPAERDAAAELMQRYAAQRFDYQLPDYQALPAADRIAHLREMSAELDAEIARRVETRRAAAAEADGVGDADPALRVAKGPRGLWFVMRGDERIGKGHDTEAEAMEAASF